MPRFSRRHFLALSLAAAGAACARTQASPEVLRGLQNGGHVIYFRHAATAWKGKDLQSWPREEQRPLSEDGIAQSRRIGARFAALGVPVDEVRASPFYRCTDMGEIAFGSATRDDGLLSPTNPSTSPRRSLGYLAERLSTPRDGQGNLVLIAHTTNLQLLEGMSLAEGEAAVFRPMGGGEYAFLGRVLPDDW